MKTTWRVRPRVALPVLVTLAGLLVAGVYLASPLVIRTRTVEESPFALAAPAGAPSAPAESEEIVADSPPVVPATAAMLAATLELMAGPQAPQTRSGSFSDRDQIHRGSGLAILGPAPQGTTVLRFESFSVTNGPDLHVFLSRSLRPTSHDEVHDGVYIGKLRATDGAFNYELPDGTDVTAMRSVVIYCVPFRVIFTSAPLT